MSVIVIMTVILTSIVSAGIVFFNVQFPLFGVDCTLVDWKAKDNTTNGSYLGTADEHLYLSNLESCWVWTDLEFVNSGNIVQFSPRTRVYNDTYNNWLGAFIEFDAAPGDTIRLRANHGKKISPYSYVRAKWNFN